MMQNVISFVSRGNFVILAILVVVAGIVSPHFWTAENIFNVVRAASLIGIVAIGMNVVIIGGGIDLSVGSVVALTGAVAASLWVSDAHFLLFIAIPLVVAASVGFANGALVSWLGLQPFVATLVLMSVARGAGLVFTGGQPIYADYPDFFLFLSRGTLLGVPIPTVVFVTAAFVTWYLMKWRVFGREVTAIGANETAARLSGVKVSWVKMKTYLYCALLAGISGLVLTSRMESGEPGQAGIFWELDAIAAVVIGGTSIRGGSGSIWGAFVGALIIGIVGNLFNLLGVGPAWQQVAKGAIILMAVILQAISDRGGLRSLSWPTMRWDYGTLPMVKVIGGVAALLVAINLALWSTTPSLFQIDLAKAPYTRANNLELTRVYHRAIPLYQEVIDRFPESGYAILSRIGIANSARGGANFELASETYAALLADIENGMIGEEYRYEVLRNYALMLQESGDGAAFEIVFSQLEEHFPDDEATREARRHLEQLQAAAAAGEDAELPENAPVIIGSNGISMPESVQVGDRFEITILMEPNEGHAATFSLMTALPFWRGFNLVRAEPNPRSVAEFWGRRAWSFAALTEPTTVTATLEARRPGTYEFDLDVELSFDVIEYGIVRQITVQE
ncbi:ABC transporter permease subunit [Nioella ostreopsis]|uniref:ABC transporter permease subunit n=1 Tax=Nioella ostreopsis TaxID=2448479 RepID=UPI000FDC24EA|nr:hypothetical protein [Nioella ostreopsis]